jgi:hypothetical protein
VRRGRWCMAPLPDRYDTGHRQLPTAPSCRRKSYVPPPRRWSRGRWRDCPDQLPCRLSFPEARCFAAGAPGSPLRRAYSAPCADFVTARARSVSGTGPQTGPPTAMQAPSLACPDVLRALSPRFPKLKPRARLLCRWGRLSSRHDECRVDISPIDAGALVVMLV